MRSNYLIDRVNTEVTNDKSLVWQCYNDAYTDFFQQSRKSSEPLTSEKCGKNLRKFFFSERKRLERNRSENFRSVFSSDAHWLKLHTNNSRSHRARKNINNKYRRITIRFSLNVDYTAPKFSKINM